MAEEIITCETCEERDWTVLALAGRLDRTNSAEVGEKAEAVFASSQKFAVDVKELVYLSSAGIRILLRLAKMPKAGKKSFAICGAEGFVKEVLEDSNMNVLVTICPDRSQLE